MLLAPSLSNKHQDLGPLDHPIPKALRAVSLLSQGRPARPRWARGGQAGVVWQDLQPGWPRFWCSGGRLVESVPLYGQLGLIVIV